MPSSRPRPIHPGEILREEYLIPLGLSGKHLADDLHVPPNRVCQIVAERRRLTADTALRLARYFRTSPEYWMTLQTIYDLHVARKVLGKTLLKIQPCPMPHSEFVTTE